MALKFSIFNKFPELRYGLSERDDGTMRLSGGVVSEKNRKRFFEHQQIKIGNVITARLVHGNKVVEVGASEIDRVVEQADALLTKDHDISLSITVADCFPVYFFDPIKTSMAIAHVGWRGVTNNIVSNVITKMLQTGSAVGDIRVAIGPGIQVCHFEFQDGAYEVFHAYPDAIIDRNDTTYVDLSGIIEQQVQASGVKSEHFEQSRVCTFCADEQYFSYRRKGVKYVETMAAYIGLHK